MVMMIANLTYSWGITDPVEPIDLADQTDSYEVDADIRDIEKQHDQVFKLMEAHCESRKSGEELKNFISFLSYIHDERGNVIGLDVGLADVEDENLKKEILSLPGMDSALVKFIQFEFAWSGPATEPPKD